MTATILKPQVRQLIKAPRFEEIQPEQHQDDLFPVISDQWKLFYNYKTREVRSFRVVIPGIYDIEGRYFNANKVTKLGWLGCPDMGYIGHPIN